MTPDNTPDDTADARRHRQPQDRGRGWALSVSLRVAELEAVAAAAQRAGWWALAAGLVLVPVGLAAARHGRWVGAVRVVVGGERLARAARHRRRARRVEIEALTHQLGAGVAPPLEPWPTGAADRGPPPQRASASASNRGWRTAVGSRQ
jgi:hypothetical protein